MTACSVLPLIPEVCLSVYWPDEYGLFELALLNWPYKASLFNFG